MIELKINDRVINKSNPNVLVGTVGVVKIVSHDGLRCDVSFPTGMFTCYREQVRLASAAEAADDEQVWSLYDIDSGLWFSVNGDWDYIAAVQRYSANERTNFHRTMTGDNIIWIRLGAKAKDPEPHCNHDAAAVRDGICECGQAIDEWADKVSRSMFASMHGEVQFDDLDTPTRRTWMKASRRMIDELGL